MTFDFVDARDLFIGARLAADRSDLDPAVGGAEAHGRDVAAGRKLIAEAFAHHLLEVPYIGEILEVNLQFHAILQ